MANCGWLWNDGSFLGWSDGAILTNVADCASEPGGAAAEAAAAAAAAAAGGFAKAWDDHWKDKRKRDARKIERRFVVYQTEEYKRLMRKLGMAKEHLLDAKNKRDIDFIKSAIEKLEEQMHKLEHEV
jgi:glycine/D-amino acid oxidase-like deaminating enzyme